MADGRRDPGDLEAALRGLEPAWPPTPDLATAVRPRLSPRRGRRARARSWLLATLAGAVAATMAIEPARSAVLELLGLQSVRVERRAPDPSPRPFGAELDLGKPSTLERARRVTGLEITPPRTLGDPDGVWLREGPDGISLLYRRPRVLVQILGGGLDTPIVEKAVGPDVRVEPVRGGYFLSGAPHGVGYVGPDGTPVFEDQRLAGNTLLVERHGVLIRIEGRLSRARALEVADSLQVRTARP